MKKIMQTGLVALMLLAISCTKSSIHNTREKGTQTQENAETKIAGHYVGQKFGGGVVFYVTADGKHGLIADSLDLGDAVWYNGTYTATGATATNGGAGKGNTKVIVAAQGIPISPDKNYAAWICSKSRRNGYSDWFLPSREELSELYRQKELVGYFPSNGYWSSSEIDESYAWYVGFNDGRQGFYLKQTQFFVRAIRIF